jgi:predicted DNA-binding transcriptional regulator AlpA
MVYAAEAALVSNLSVVAIRLYHQSCEDKHMEQHNSAAALLGKNDLCELLHLSARGIENMVRDGTFPPPVRIGKRVYWSALAVHRWREALFTAQESWTPG